MPNELESTLEKVPSGVWWGIAIGGGLLFVFGRLRGGSAASSSGSLPTGSGYALPSTGSSTPVTQPYGGPTLTTANTPPGASPLTITFAQALQPILPSVYNPSGFSNSFTDTQQGTQDFFNTLKQFGSNNTNYQDWLGQLQGASNSGNVALFHQLLQTGQSYGNVFGNQTVQAVGGYNNYYQFLNNPNTAPSTGPLNEPPNPNYSAMIPYGVVSPSGSIHNQVQMAINAPSALQGPPGATAPVVK